MQNAVTRGDVRVRVPSIKVLGLVTLYLGLMAAGVLLLVPLEVGGDQRLRLDPVYLISAMQVVLLTYMVSGSACGEIAIEGEKNIWDLATMPFSSRTIVYGKALSAVLSSLLLLILSAPFHAVAVGLTGTSPLAVIWGWVLAFATSVVATAVALLGMTLSGSEAIRSLIHWAWLGVLLVLSAFLPQPWRLLNPFRALGEIETGGWTWAAVPATYLGLSLVFLEWARWRLEVGRGSRERSP